MISTLQPLRLKLPLDSKGYGVNGVKNPMFYVLDLVCLTRNYGALYLKKRL